jgi:hypothetical protein
MFFLSSPACADFTVVITDVWVVILSGQIIELAVYANAQVIFPCLLEVFIHLCMKYGLFK